MRVQGQGLRKRVDTWGTVQWGVVLLRLSLPGKSVTESGLYLSRLSGPREVWRERGSWLRPVVSVSVSSLPMVTDQPEQREAGSGGQRADRSSRVTWGPMWQLCDTLITSLGARDEGEQALTLLGGGEGILSSFLCHDLRRATWKGLSIPGQELVQELCTSPAEAGSLAGVHSVVGGRFPLGPRCPVPPASGAPGVC